MLWRMIQPSPGDVTDGWDRLPTFIGRYVEELRWLHGKERHNFKNPAFLYTAYSLAGWNRPAGLCIHRHECLLHRHACRLVHSQARMPTPLARLQACAFAGKNAYSTVTPPGLCICRQECLLHWHACRLMHSQARMPTTRYWWRGAS